MGTKFFLVCLTNCIEFQANFETFAALTFWFRIIFKTPVNYYLSNSKITATVIRRLPILRSPAAAPGTTRQLLREKGVSASAVAAPQSRHAPSGQPATPTPTSDSPVSPPHTPTPTTAAAA